LEILSTTDHLTGLINHRHMHETLQLELERASRHQRPLSFIMIDVDHFKKYNDTHGHPKGDRLLSDIAKFLAQSVRNIDIVARYGGEEFGIILPDTSLASAREIAERLRTQFHEKFEQTLSLGVSNYPDIEAEDVAQSLIDSADKALYSAKKNGRNQTVIAQKLV
jgi:two-component system cell cycle response regulator